jgi:Tfp pilus assembly protein PilN
MRLHRQAAAEGKRKQDIERQRERRKLWMLLIMAPVVLALIYVISHSLSPR